MRLPFALVFVAEIFISAVAGAADADAAAVVAKQKQAALANSRTLQMAPLGKAESAHFLLFGVSTDARLKVLAGNLERQFAAAFKALQFDSDDKPWTGKLTVYIFADRGQFRSFVRQIEKRSPDDGDQSSASVRGDLPHIGVASGQGKDAVTADMQAGYEVAMALMSVRAKGTQLPEWLMLGFARATVSQAASTPAGVRKRIARQLAARVKPAEAWNDTLSIEQRLPLATSIADYLFFGKGVPRPGDFLLAFRPDDEKPMKTVMDALEAAKISPEKFEAGYLAWLRSNN